MRVFSTSSGKQKIFRGIQLPIFGGDARDYLNIVDDTTGILHGYLYHRCGSIDIARKLLGELYLSMLPRSMSRLWFRHIDAKDIFYEADRMLARLAVHPSDIDNVYLPSLSWMVPDEHRSMSSMHDALWSLPERAQRLLVLSMLVGVPVDRIAKIEDLPKEQIVSDIEAARKDLIQRWQPTGSLQSKLQSMVFAPNLSIADERTMRSDIIAKYSAMRMRRYQWVITAGFLTIFANFIVASVLAFAVVTEPQASLKQTGKQLAAVDAALQSKRFESLDAKYLLVRFYRQTQAVSEQYTANELSAIGASVAADAARRQRETDEQMQKLLRLIDSAQRISFVLPLQPAIMVATLVKVMTW